MNYSHIYQFKEFLENELGPATKELENFQSDDSRKHIQKLVFTNLIDRLDYCIDNTLLDMLEEDNTFKDEVLNKHDQSMIERDMLRIIIADDPKSIVLSMLKDTLRGTELKKRHSLKLKKLLNIFEITDQELHRPRVNPSTGHITEKFKVQNKKIPPSILGYSDWLYSRRNAIVHGGGKQDILENDVRQLEKLYNVKPAPKCKLTLASINSASQFYSDLMEILLLKIQ